MLFTGLRVSLYSDTSLVFISRIFPSYLVPAKVFPTEKVKETTHFHPFFLRKTDYGAKA